VKRIESFFFKPIDAWPLAVFRLLHGAVVALTLLLLFPERELWFSERGILTQLGAFELYPEARINILAWFPGIGSLGLAAYLLALVCLAAMSGVGLYPRLSAALLYLGLTSLHHRNPMIMNGGDTLLRVTCFWLIFAPPFASIRSARQEPLNVEPWTLRMIQLQLAIVYLSGGIYKLIGAQWRGGSAIYYATRHFELRRWDPWPFSWVLSQPALVQLMTWTVLAFELLFPFLIWSPRFRRPLLITGLLIHGGLEILFNLPMFQWAVFACYAAFSLRPARLTRSLTTH